MINVAALVLIIYATILCHYLIKYVRKKLGE